MDGFLYASLYLVIFPQNHTYTAKYQRLYLDEIAMREDYTTASSEREFYISEIKEELDLLYDEISTDEDPAIHPLEDDWTEDNE